MAIIYAPFTDDQVAALWRWQLDHTKHPYICTSCKQGKLIPKTSGWICPVCGKKQDWCNDATAKYEGK